MTTRQLLPLFLVLGGCFQGSDLSEVLPDERIQVNLPMDEGTTAKGLAKDEIEWSTWYLFTASTTENINAMIASVLFWVDTVTTNHRPSYVDRDTNQAEWGPWSTALDPVETMLWVDYDIDNDAHAWGFDQWPRDAEREDATTVIIGEVDPGATREISSGRFDVDFNTINELDPTETTTGLFQVEYDIHESGVTAQAIFTDFGEDQLDATYAYDQLFEGDGMMDLVLTADVNPESGTALEESWYTRSRWKADGSGRVDIRVTGGDLGELVANISECWSNGFEQVWYSESLTGIETGDASLCAFDQPEYNE